MASNGISTKLLDWLLTPENVDKAGAWAQKNIKLIEKLTQNKMLPSAARLYLRSIAGSKTKITEDFFSKSELAEIKKRVAEAEVSKALSGHATSGGGSMGRAVQGHSGIGYATDKAKTIPNAFKYPDVNIDMTLGQAGFYRNEDGTYQVYDKHNFSNMMGSLYWYGNEKEITKQIDSLSHIYDSDVVAGKIIKRFDTIEPNKEVLAKVIEAYKNGEIPLTKLMRTIGGYLASDDTKEVVKKVKPLLGDEYEYIDRVETEDTGVPISLNIGAISQKDKYEVDTKAGFGEYDENWDSTKKGEYDKAPTMGEVYAQMIFDDAWTYPKGALEHTSGKSRTTLVDPIKMGEYEDVGIPSAIRMEAQKYIKKRAISELDPNWQEARQKEDHYWDKDLQMYRSIYEKPDLAEGVPFLFWDEGEATREYRDREKLHHPTDDFVPYFESESGEDLYPGFKSKKYEYKAQPKEKEMMATGGNVPSTDIKDYWRRSWGIGDRVGFDEGTKPVLPRDKFVELRIKYKTTHTNAEFAELLNENWKPAQVDSFNKDNVAKRIKDAKKFFPDNFDYKGSNIERAVTEKKMIELWGEENYQKHKKNFSEKKLNEKYSSDLDYKKLPIDKRQTKSKKSTLLKKKKLEAMSDADRQKFLDEQAIKDAERTRKNRGQIIKFNKNPRDFKSILWGDLVSRTYGNYYTDESGKLKIKPVGLEPHPFKLSEDSLKFIKSKTELNRGDMEKITLIDKNGKPFKWDTLESYVKEGNALNSKGQPMSWDEVTKTERIREFINKEGLAQTINKATIPNYDPKKHVRTSGWNIAHNTSFNNSPWEKHIAPARANIQEGQARKKFLNLWDGSDAEFKEGKITKQKRFELRKQAVTDYKKTMEPITEIKYSLSKKQHGAATPIEKLFKKAGIKLNAGQIKKAQVFLRSALNKGQDLSKYLPFKTLRKPGMAGVAAIDYSLFHFIFGVPGPTAALGASAWLTPRPVSDAIVAQTQSMSFIDEMNQKKAEKDKIENLEASKRLRDMQSTATDIEPFELDEKKEDNLTGVDQYIINRYK